MSLCLKVLSIHHCCTKKWGISPKKGHTTHHGVCTVLHPSLCQWFRINNHQLYYRRFPCNVYSDTLVFRRGNRCAQIFATDFDWSHQLSMKLKTKACEALFLIICNNFKEMNLSEFKRRCHLRQTEQFTPWLDAAEKKIKELKKGSCWKLIRTGAPKRLLDNCLEPESYIRSNTAYGIYKLDGELPETIMSGETSTTSYFTMS